MSKNKIEIGDYTVLPTHSKIVFEEQEFKLEPKIMQVLCFLIEHRNEVVSREQIVETLWPNTVTGLEVVTRAIFELRKIFKDDAKSAKYIETIARKGYSFIYPLKSEANEKTDSVPDSTLQPNLSAAPNLSNQQDGVSHLSESPNVSSLSQPNETQANAANSSNTPFLYKLGFALLAVVFLLYFLNDGDAGNQVTKEVVQPAPVQYHTSLLTDASYRAEMPVLSPDARRVLFVKTLNGDSISNGGVSGNSNDEKEALVLVDVDSQKFTVLRETNKRFRSPLWSDDGNVWIYALCEKNNQNCDIIKHVVDTDEYHVVLHLESRLMSLALSPSATQLAVEVMRDRVVEIGIIDLGHDSPEISYLAELGANPNSIAFYDDQTLIYATQVSHSVFLNHFDLETKDIQSVETPFHNIFGLVRKSDNAFWIAERTSGASSIWTYDLQKNDFIKSIAISPGTLPSGIDANELHASLVYSSFKRDINVGILSNEVVTQAFSNAGKMNGTLIDFNAIYSPLDDAYYFISNRSGTYDLWRFSNNETDKISQLSANRIERPVLSKNGKKLAFLSLASDGATLNVLDIETQLLDVTHSITENLSILAWENEKALFVSGFIDGEYQIQSFNLSTGKRKTAVLDAGLMVSQDDELAPLYFTKMSTQTLMAKFASGEVKAIHKLLENERPLVPHQIKMVNNKLYYLATVKGERMLVSFDLESQKVVHHFTVPNRIYVTYVGVSKENQPFVIYDQTASEHSQLVLLTPKH